MSLFLLTRRVLYNLTVGIIGRSDGKHGMLGNPYMLGTPAPGVTAPACIYLLFFFIPAAIQKEFTVVITRTIVPMPNQH